ncbi:MAG: hypothetical protein NC132_01485 [Corallococcus sp.]|nr:hypothetical protein [Corallococcus sp.]MCM1359330.1 hypothetical protein [Corallococcus sp.]MCM1394773.1 hypothetical protein [Corallococcus sp.]
MSKCYICGKDTNVEIEIKSSEGTRIICGICAIEKKFIADPDIVELIREAEGLPQLPEKYCTNCKHLACKLLSSDKYYCKYHKVCITEKEMDGRACDNHDFK